MKIATFNANSIRARLETVLDWLAENEPDVLAIQETKCENEKFPYADFEEAGWNVAIHGQKSYNGVAIVSRHPIQNVRLGFEDPTWPEDCRIIAASVNGLEILNTYVPNGTEVGTEKFDYKLRWLPRFKALVSERYLVTHPVVWLGDINIAPTEHDVYNPKRHFGKVGFHPDEIAALDEILAWGWVDCFRKFHEGPGHYTFWDFLLPRGFERNLGWRIDHIYATPVLAAKCTACMVDREPRGGARPSDHTFVYAEFDI